MKKIYLLFLLFATFSNNNYATSEKDWFCAQRLVANISRATVWHYGHNEVFEALQQNKIVVSKLIKNTADALLNTQDNRQNASVIIQNFSKQVVADKSKLSLLFAYLLRDLRQQKQEKIDYVLNYGHSHQKRVLQLQFSREKIRAAIKNKSVKLADLEQQYQWQITVLNARKKHNPYLCEQVVDVDAYAFFLAQEIGKYMVNND